MAKLLSPAQIVQIRAALQDVVDTFMDTPVLYKMSVDSLDRFNEDRKDEKFVDYELKGLVEYSTEKGEHLELEQDGALNTQDVKISFGLDDLDALGLITPELEVKFQVEKDYFITNGLKYKVTFVGLDGPIEKRNILVVIYGTREPIKS